MIHGEQSFKNSYYLGFLLTPRIYVVAFKILDPNLLFFVSLIFPISSLSTRKPIHLVFFEVALGSTEPVITKLVNSDQKQSAHYI